jgi:hypothetical protein
MNPRHIPTYVPIKLGRRRYTVVRDSKGVIRIAFQNGVYGGNLHLNGRTARRVLLQLEKLDRARTALAKSN